jgi:ribonuclease P protein component
MIENKYRFHGYGSLRYVYRNGRTTRTRRMSLRYNNNPTRVHSRVAVVVAKKVVKAAPKRNRIRRRIYEVLRTDWPHIAPHHDLVITVHSAELLTVPFAELQHEVQQILASARLLSARLEKDENSPQ